MAIVSMRKLLENGVHFGHQTRKWNPKCKPYIYAAKGGIYIINLEKTVEELDVAYAKLKEICEKGGKVLLVGTKKQAQQIILDEALRSGSFYINQRWLGGTLTNFRTIQKRIKRLVEIEEMEASGTINHYTKKEIAQLRKESTKLENFLGGIKEMKKLPDAVIVVDPTEEHNAVLEAKKLRIPVFGLIDTNCDPSIVDYPIPANDDAIKSIRLIISILCDAIVETKSGVLQDAYQEDEEEADITMEDVMINVKKFMDEQEKRRKARENANRNNQRGRKFGSERRYFPKKEESGEAPAETPATEVAAEAESVAVEAVAEAVETVKEEATND
ncbi:MAG: 30S ribosomal protein S2 [Erysipelotrichaceae bacterium]|nr:30S ribosomal protein S2 [Erysipelotrichaceae bacterium]